MPRVQRVAQIGKVCPKCGQIHQRCLAHKSMRVGGPNGKQVPCSNHRMEMMAVCWKHGGKSPLAQKKAKELKQEVLANLIDPERILREMCKVAYFNLADIFDEKGQLRPVAELPRDVAAALAGVEVAKRNLTTGDRETDEVIKVRAVDKLKALEMLAKHQQLFVERVEHSGGMTIKWED